MICEAKEKAAPRRRERKRLTDEQAFLAGEHWDWAMKIAQVRKARYRGSRLESLDWEGAAAIGLCDAAASFEPDRGLKFRTHADPRIRGEIFDMLRAEELLGHRRGRGGPAPEVDSLAKVVHVDAGGKTVILEHLIADDSCPSPGEDLESVENFEQALKPLPSASREAFRGYYRDNKTMREIGEGLNLSESRVSQLHSQSLEILRESRLTREALTA